jgi:DNA processing protein
MSQTERDLKYKIAISLIPGVGNILSKKLIEKLGGIVALFQATRSDLMQVPGIGPAIADNIINQEVMERAGQEVEFIASNGIRTLFYLDEDYPERLKHCDDAPVMLYMKGDLDLNQTKVISVVGTRNATAYGKEICANLVGDLKNRGHDVLIISGLAYGIDICAHRQALSNGLKTAAVLGHGLNTIYPSIHAKTAREIVKEGALLSEFTTFENPERNNFVKRNRIIAGLADATLVIESGEKGGALTTADIAHSYYRDVFAVPGRLGDRYSSGCNFLIKSNRAALLENVRDLEYIMGWEKPAPGKGPRQGELFLDLSAEEKEVAGLLSEGDLTIDEIALRIKMPVSQVSPLLLNLEFKGVLASLPGMVYKLRNSSML